MMKCLWLRAVSRLCRVDIAAILALVLSANVASSQNIAREDRVIFELTKPIVDPKNFNWFFPGVRREQGAHQAMYEPLFLFNYKTGVLDPWLAESITPNAAQDVWTLKLRDDVKWSDSKPGHDQPFTASDVQFTAEMVLRSDFVPSAYEAVAFKSQVKSPVTVVDPFTVEFTLNKPNPRFALETFGGTMFSSFLIMPRHIWVGQDPTQYPFYSTDFSKPVGTGPYKLEESDKTHTKWIRDDNWWGAKKDAHGNPVFKPLPEPKQLEWLVVDTLSDSKKKLKDNDLDAARPYSLNDFNDVKSQNPKIVGWDPSSVLAWNDRCARQLDIYTLDKKLDGKTPNVWSDPNLRKALSLLIDRTVLAEDGYKGATTPSKTMFAQYAPMNPFIDAVVKAGYGVKPAADSAAADALLTSPASGYAKDPADGYYKKGGTKLAATLKVDSSVAPDVDGANALSTQLNKAGIQIDVKTVPHDEFWGHVVPAGDYDMVYSWLSCGSVAEPFTSMNRYTSNPLPGADYRAIAFRDTGRWSTKAATGYSNEVIAIGTKRLGDPNVPDLVAHAYKYLADEMPIIPLVQSPTIVPFNTTYWTGWPTAGGNTVPMTDWEGTMRTIHELTTSKCVKFFRSLPAEMNGIKFDVDSGATLAPDSLGQIGLSNHTITISFGLNDRPLALSLRANATGKSATFTGVSDTGATQFVKNPSIPEAGIVVPTNPARQLKLTGDPNVLLSKVCFAD
jgi:peptide/nickel transport system substrate-binding protein